MGTSFSLSFRLGKHLKLFKFIVLDPQDQQMCHIRRTLELKDVPVLPLSQAIPADKWSAFCVQQEEKKIQEEKKEEEAAEHARCIARDKESLERVEARAAIARAALGVRKLMLADIERELQTPLPPFPIEPPPIPTTDSVFKTFKQIRKLSGTLDRPKLEKRPSTAHIQLNIPGLSFHIPEVKVNEVEKLDTDEPWQFPRQFLSGFQKRVPGEGDLVPPPDTRYLEPLNPRKYRNRKAKSGIEMSEEDLDLPIMSVKRDTIGNTNRLDVFMPIPIDEKISRDKATNVITASLTNILDAWKNWADGLLEYEKVNWQARYATYRKIKAEKELTDRELSEAKATLAQSEAAKAASLRQTSSKPQGKESPKKGAKKK